jgi:CheY-like chemotaxis protein
MSLTARSDPGSAAPLQVLVVEDDERSGRMLAELLRRDGFAVELCAGGQAGLQRLTDGPAPDVVVTDLRMPQIDGIAIVRQARGLRQTLPIVIVTAYPDLARRLEGAGPMPQLFVKPLDYPALVGALRDLQRSA